METGNSLIVGDDDCSFGVIIEILENSPTFHIFVKEWSKLAHMLGLSSYNVEVMKLDVLHGKKNHFDLLYGILVKWRLDNSNEATLDCLLDVIGNKCHWTDMKNALVFSPKLKVKIQVTKDSSWKDLNKYTQSLILDKPLMFQGYETTLKKMLINFENYEANNTWSTKLNGADLDQLANCKNFELVADVVPKMLPYYIPRVLSGRTKIDPVIFGKNCSDIFIFRGISLSKLSQIADGKLTRTSSEQMEMLTVRFIKLDHELDINSLVEAAKMKRKAIHLITYENMENAFVWNTTWGNYGSLELIQNHLTIYQDKIDEETLIKDLVKNFTNNPIIVSDSPGMGKTILIGSIAREIKRQCPNRPIFFVVLREFVQQLSQLSTIKEQDICDALVNSTNCNNELGKYILLQKLIDVKEPIELFLDGYDEILSSQIPTAHKFIDLIRQKFQNIRIFITVRPHMLHVVEAFMEVLGYNICPFHEVDQENFLVEYWGHKIKHVNSRKLQQFARFCLANLKKDMINFDRDIAGIPLQCYILAEIYLTFATRFCSGPENDEARTLEYLLPIKSISDMYQYLIESRFQRAEELHRTKFQNPGMFQMIWKYISPQQVNQNFKRYLFNVHVYAACKLIFPKLSEKFSAFLFDDLIPPNFEDFFFVGLLESRGNQSIPSFVHRTIAEYLLAKISVEMLTLENENLASSEIIAKPNLFVVRNILSTKPCLQDDDRYWNKRDMFWELGKNYTYDLDQQNTDTISTDEKEDNETLFVANNQQNYLAETTFIRNTVKVFQFRYSTLCHFINSLLVLNDLDENTVRIRKDCSETYRNAYANQFYTIAISSARKNLLKLFAFAIEAFKYVRSSSHDETPWLLLLSTAIRCSNTELVVLCCERVEAILKKKISSFELLRFPLSLEYEEFKEQNGTPLHAALARGSYSMSEYFIYKYGKHLTKQNCLLVHLVGHSNRDSPGIISERLEILKLLVNRFCEIDGNDENLYASSKHWFIEMVHFNLVKDLIVRGAYVSILDFENSQHKTLAHTIPYGHSVDEYHELVELLINRGENQLFKVQTKPNGKTPIHCALECLELRRDTLMLLSEAVDNDLSFKDYDGNNLFFSAIEGGRSRAVLQVLLELGVDWKETNNVCETVVHCSSYFGNLDALEYFIELGAEVNSVDDIGNTGLHLAMIPYLFEEKRINEVIEVLLDAGADVNIKNKDGFSSLWYARNGDCKDLINDQLLNKMTYLGNI